MSDFELREYTAEQYKADMDALLKEKGLKGAIKHYCDLIDEEVSGTGYVMHRTVQEYLNDILYLVGRSEK